MRIGTFGHSDALVQQMLRHQTEFARTQLQLETGKKYNDIAGFGAGTSTLVSSKSLLSRLDGFYESNVQVLGRLNAFNDGLTELEAIGGRLRDAIHTARGAGSGTGFITEVRNLVQQAASVLNIRFEGRFLFGGTVTDQPPVAISDGDDLLALAEPPAGDFFNDLGVTPSARLDERTSVEVGSTASSVAQDLLHSMQRILMFNDGTLPAGAGAFAPAGPFEGQLTDNQIAFLEDELGRIRGAIDTILTAATDNGLNIRAVEDVQERLTDQKITLTELVSEREDADLAETATKLNQQQFALEASFQVIAQLRELSLVNFV